MPACPKCRADCDATHRFCHACGKALGAKSGDPLVGSTLPGGYVIGPVIAEGGMGRIYRAEQRALDRSVAVKVVHPHLLSDATIRSRFFVEARTASRLNHPNAVRVIAFGEVPGGQPYLVMELLGGTPLTNLAADGPLPLPRIAGLLTQALGALDEAHGLGIVHRDFKPDNVIVETLRSGADLVKVIDFGLAHLLSETTDDGRSGPSFAVAGTPSYMSPEQARGERVDGRSDLYSAGIVLYELVTGRLPFEGETATQTLLSIVNDRPIDPRERAPERNIDEKLARVMIRALAKQPSARFQSAHELAAALSDAIPPPSIRHSRPPRARSIPPPAPEAACSACGARNALPRAFCGECGASLVAKRREGSR